jgi:hypothetical protein
MENREGGGRKEALDKEWYRRFVEEGSFQAYEYFDGDKAFRDEEKRKFLAGETENPTLDYPKIDKVQLDGREEALLALKKDVLAREADPTVKQVYRWRINEKLAEVRLLRATADGDMERFVRYSKFVYGEPSKEIFAYTVNQIRGIAERKLKHESEDVRAVAERVLAQFEKQEVDFEKPDSALVEAVNVQTRIETDHLATIEGEDTHEFKAEEIVEVFDEALHSLEAEGWSVVIDTSSKTGISVDQENKAVKVPSTRTLDKKKLETLVAHEIGTHVARRVNGERSKLQLLGLGLDRYEVGEEGVATAREQSFDSEVDEFAGLDGHLAIALALGLDGKPRDFKGVYQVIEDISYLRNAKKGRSHDEVLSLSQKTAWDRSIRAFRGTDAKTKGVCFTKDIIYREGNIGVWEALKKNPEEMMRWSVGKYDPANERHLWVLNQLGISEQDLEDVNS